MLVRYRFVLFFVPFIRKYEISHKNMGIGTGPCLRAVQYDHYSQENWADLTVVRFRVDFGRSVSQAGKEIKNIHLSWTFSIHPSAFQYCTTNLWKAFLHEDPHYVLPPCASIQGLIYSSSFINMLFSAYTLSLISMFNMTA